MSSFYPENEKKRTQDLESAYYDVGQFYWGYRDSWLKNTAIHNNGVGYVIPSWRVVDIDTPEDWVRAELFFKFLAMKET
jgi:N-acylneuraminate cytidylyltransferase